MTDSIQKKQTTRKMKDSQILNDKDEDRMKVLNVLMAANCYDTACMFSCFAKRSNTIVGAQEIAKIIQSFSGKNMSEFYRIKLTEDYSNNAIQSFEVYTNAAKIYPFDARALESFCKFYAHAGYEFNVWKWQADYIIGIGLAFLGYSLGKITSNERDERINTVKSSEMCVFRYSPSLVLRSFASISAKFKEIEAKVKNRNSKNQIN